MSGSEVRFTGGTDVWVFYPYNLSPGLYKTRGRGIQGGGIQGALRGTWRGGFWWGEGGGLKNLGTLIQNVDALTLKSTHFANYSI